MKKPTEKQLKARAKFAEQARARGKQYTITAKLNDQIYTAKTNDLDQAIQELGANIKAVKTKMILTITKGGKTCERQLFAFPARRLFTNKMFRRVLINRLIFK